MFSEDISYEINNQGQTLKRLADRTRLQICNLPPLEIPTAVDNFVYVRIIRIESNKLYIFLEITVAKVIEVILSLTRQSRCFG